VFLLNSYRTHNETRTNCTALSFASSQTLSHYSSVSRHYTVVGIRLHTYMPKCRACLALVGILPKPPKCI